jgi:uncharacterized protein (TIGR04141 family)
MPSKAEPKTNKLSVYLVKSGITDLEDMVESTQEPVTVNDQGTFVFEESHPNRPVWIENFFGSTLDQQNIFTSSARGIFITSVNTEDGERWFIVTFGFGRHMIKDGVIEERFGLKIVLNSVDVTGFRSIDKTTLGSIPKHSREQMSKDVSPFEFGIDIEQDLISAVTGKSRDEHFGKTVSGKDALYASVKADVNDVKDFLRHSYTRYKSNDYKRDFDWIDQIAEVRDRAVVEQLNTALVTKLAVGEIESIWMAVPEVVDWSDISGFRYLRAKQAELHDDLDVPAYLNDLGRSPTIDELKNSRVFCISTSTEDTLYSWSAYQCLYAECRVNSKLYILNSSKWYEVADNFSEAVQNDFQNMTRSSVVLPDCEHKNEDDYNQHATSALTGSCCMDKKLITYGGGHSSIEFCDILSGDKKMIHVKKYGQSSVLSHLFTQGVVSGELFVSDEDFRTKLNTKLPDSHKLADITARPIAPEYEIVYAIISNSEDGLDLPFFSKVSLRNAKRRLTGYGYNVTIKKIQKVEKSIAE